MKIANSIQNNLAYQKQLFNTVDKLVTLRTDLIKSAVLILNEGKDKEWPNFNSQVKYLKKNLGKIDDPNLKTISEILMGIDAPIKQLEANLELKNNFIQVISEQSLEVPVETEQ